MRKLPPTLNDALGFNIDRVAKLIRHELTQALADYDLSPEQWQIMAVIWDSDVPLSQQQITWLTLKDKHNLSRMVKRLEANGWLVKYANPDDARSYLITATANGRAQRDAVTNAIYEHVRKTGIGLTEEEQTQLLNLLKKIRKHSNDDEGLEPGD